MRSLARWFWLSVGACVLAAPLPLAAQSDTPAETTEPAVAKARRNPEPEVLRLPLVIDGATVEVVSHLYRPAGNGPFPLVIFSHGRAPARTDRMQLKAPVLPGHAGYWLRQGVAVLAPVRPGYGETGGPDLEDTHVRWGTNGCQSQPDFARAAHQARRVIAATYQWALQQPWVRKDRLLLEGQSVGGMATMATAALNLPGVVGVVNFAGGSGGNPTNSPGQSCMPERLAELYRDWGQVAKVPSLWLYARNDLFWGELAPRAWHVAYAAGGSDAQWVQTGPVEGHDGHQLLRYGGRMWSVPLDAFVRQVGLTAP
jgi:dienelactone hydrolase